MSEGCWPRFSATRMMATGAIAVAMSSPPEHVAAGQGLLGAVGVAVAGIVGIVAGGVYGDLGRGPLDLRVCDDVDAHLR